MSAEQDSVPGDDNRNRQELEDEHLFHLRVVALNSRKNMMLNEKIINEEDSSLEHIVPVIPSKRKVFPMKRGDVVPASQMLNEKKINEEDSSLEHIVPVVPPERKVFRMKTGDVPASQGRSSSNLITIRTDDSTEAKAQLLYLESKLNMQKPSGPSRFSRYCSSNSDLNDSSTDDHSSDDGLRKNMLMSEIDNSDASCAVQTENGVKTEELNTGLTSLNTLLPNQSSLKLGNTHNTKPQCLYDEHTKEKGTADSPELRSNASSCPSALAIESENLISTVPNSCMMIQDMCENNEYIGTNSLKSSKSPNHEQIGVSQIWQVNPAETLVEKSASKPSKIPEKENLEQGGQLTEITPQTGFMDVSQCSEHDCRLSDSADLDSQPLSPEENLSELSFTVDGSLKLSVVMCFSSDDSLDSDNRNSATNRNSNTNHQPSPSNKTESSVKCTSSKLSYSDIKDDRKIVSCYEQRRFEKSQIHRKNPNKRKRESGSSSCFPNEMKKDNEEYNTLLGRGDLRYVLEKRRKIGEEKKKKVSIMNDYDKNLKNNVMLENYSRKNNYRSSSEQSSLESGELLSDSSSSISSESLHLKSDVRKPIDTFVNKTVLKHTKQNQNSSSHKRWCKNDENERNSKSGSPSPSCSKWSRTLSHHERDTSLKQTVFARLGAVKHHSESSDSGEFSVASQSESEKKSKMKARKQAKKKSKKKKKKKHSKKKSKVQHKKMKHKH